MKNVLTSNPSCPCVILKTGVPFLLYISSLSHPDMFANVNNSCPDPKLIMFLMFANPDMLILLWQGSPTSNPNITIAPSVRYIHFLLVCAAKCLCVLHLLDLIVCVLQLKAAEALGKPARELAVIHVSLAATYTDLMQHSRAVEHYKQELALRQGSPAEVTLPSTTPGINAIYVTRLFCCIRSAAPG